MQTRTFGWTGVQVPELGQGTWKMEDDEPDAAAAALRKGLAEGMRHIDTAELYGSGRVEDLVGRVLEGRRAEVFLVSKVMPSNASREGTVKACERSLRRLRTDHLDCYLLHWPGSEPLEETIAAFEELVSTGKIRSWGLSNFDVPALQSALRIAGPGRIACNQVLYNVRTRDIEAEVLPWCVRNAVAVVGYSPFGSGNFPASTSPGGRVLEQIAQAHGASPHQVALAFLLRDPHVLVIPKAADPKHAHANAEAAALRLSADELDRIARTFPVRTGRGLPTL